MTETERAIEASSLDVLYVMSQAERTRVIADHTRAMPLLIGDGVEIDHVLELPLRCGSQQPPKLLSSRARAVR